MSQGERVVEVVGLHEADRWLRLWGMCQAGRLGDVSTPLEVQRKREAAQKLHDRCRSTKPISEWIEIAEGKCGYDGPALGTVGAALSGAKPDSGEYRPIDDPDPRSFVVMTVDRCLLDLGSFAWQFAYHKWALERPASHFRCADWTNANDAAKKLSLKIRLELSRRISQIERATVRDRAVAEALSQLKRAS